MISSNSPFSALFIAPLTPENSGDLPGLLFISGGSHFYKSRQHQRTVGPRNFHPGLIHRGRLQNFPSPRVFWGLFRLEFGVLREFPGTFILGGLREGATLLQGTSQLAKTDAQSDSHGTNFTSTVFNKVAARNDSSSHANT